MEYTDELQQRTQEMLDKVEELKAEGWTDEAITDYLQDDYGDIFDLLAFLPVYTGAEGGPAGEPEDGPIEV